MLSGTAGASDALHDLVHEGHGGDDVAGAPAERHRAVGRWDSEGGGDVFSNSVRDIEHLDWALRICGHDPELLRGPETEDGCSDVRL